MIKRFMNWLNAGSIKQQQQLEAMRDHLQLIDKLTKQMSIEYDNAIAALHRSQYEHDALLSSYQKLLSDHEKKCLQYHDLMIIVTRLLEAVHPQLRKEIGGMIDAIQKRDSV